jgi:hypothetical protein
MRRILLLCSAALIVAGCGTEPASLEGSDDALKDASTSRIEWRLEGKDVPDWLLWTSSGVFDYGHGRGDMGIKTKGGSDLGARVVLVGRDSYLGAEVGGKMYWLKETVDDATGADRFVPGPGGTSPERLLKDLIDSSKKIEKIGSEEVRGVTTTHFRSHLDGSKLGIDSDAEEQVIVDVWIDEEGLPRRIRVPAGDVGDPVVVFDLFDFGVPVDIGAPPANEVVSEARFAKLMEKECVNAAKDPEDANPLCLIFADSELSSGPTETMPERVSDY